MKGYIGGYKFILLMEEILKTYYLLYVPLLARMFNSLMHTINWITYGFSVPWDFAFTNPKPKAATWLLLKSCTKWIGVVFRPKCFAEMCSSFFSVFFGIQEWVFDDSHIILLLFLILQGDLEGRNQISQRLGKASKGCLCYY